MDRLRDQLLAGAGFTLDHTLALVGAMRLSRSITSRICGLSR